MKKLESVLIAILLIACLTTSTANSRDSIPTDSATVSIEQLRTYAKYKSMMQEATEVAAELESYIQELQQKIDSLYAEVLAVRRIYKQQIVRIEDMYNDEKRLRIQSERTSDYLRTLSSVQANASRKRAWLFAGVGIAVGILIGILIAK